MPSATKMLLALLLVLPGLALGLVQADSAPCSDNTTGDTVDCTGTDCGANVKIGVEMFSNDANSEHGYANTTCSNASASCAFSSPGGHCGQESATATASRGPWTCRFEAHDDDWWGWDDGFTYNCYSYVAPPPTPTPSPTPTPPPPTPTPPPSECVEVRANEPFMLKLHTSLCEILASRTAALLADGSVRTFVYASGGHAVAATCAGGACVPVPTTCEGTVNDFACEVAPRRAG